MLPLSWLTAAQRAEFELRLATGYEQRTTVTILTNEDVPVSTVSAWVLDGQVDVRVPEFDRESEKIEVSRNASLTLLDPAAELGFDSGSPTGGAMYLDRMIGLAYGVRCSFGWVDCPVFVGPLTDVERDGEFVSIEAQSKELFGLSEANTTATYKEGRTVTDVFSSLMARSGEDPALVDALPDGPKLQKTFSITPESHYWFHAYRVAASVDRAPFYDGSGRCRTPLRPVLPSWLFAYGDGGMLRSLPKVGYSIDGLKNAARVSGGTPNGSKKKATGYAEAPPTHPLAAEKLGRRGTKRYMLTTEDDSALTNNTKANARARENLTDGLAQQVASSFTALPVPHLEPWDVVVVNAPHFAGEMRVNQFSLPLTADGVMTVGFNERVTNPIITRSVA